LRAIARRLPFFYGWLVVAAVFVIMAVGVNARTAFSLLFPPLLQEFGRERGVLAGAFSFGFVVSAVFSPMIGWLMDRYGPRLTNGLGVALIGGGMLLAAAASEPWHLYATLGVMICGGSVCLGYTGQSLFLPNWFQRRRGLALSLAFAGVGIGSVLLLPWLQGMIDVAGWRQACRSLGLLSLLLPAPLCLLLRRRPEDLGLAPDGDLGGGGRKPPPRMLRVVDAAWAEVDWTLCRAARTGRFWWLALGYFCAMHLWYTVQVHQTKYLLDVGFDAALAAWALGAVSLVAVPGQIALGHLADRFGREWVWSAGCLGFGLCYAALMLMRAAPSAGLLWFMVVTQGALGYGLTSVMGAIVAEIFEGRHYGTIFGTLMLSAILGGAFGPWITGVVFDVTGTYDGAFGLAAVLAAVSAFAVWRAAPRRVRAIVGTLPEVSVKPPPPA
jgi:MFS family permease